MFMIKKLYDIMKSGNVQYLNDYIKNDRKIIKTAKFVENHDEGRAVIEFKSVERANAAALITFTLPGISFHHHGQWIGKKYKLIVQMSKSEKENPNEIVKNFYSKLNIILKHDVFRKGKWTYIDSSNKKLLTWRWEYGIHKRLIVINFNPSQESTKVIISNIVGNGIVKIQDILNNVSYDRDANELRNNGLLVVTRPYWGEIFL